jgi:2-dehydropantoate 2-reductase
MRFVVYGAGAIGGVVGARLFEARHDVVLIARGAHLEAINASGLRVEDPDGSVVLPIKAVGHPRELEWTIEDVALLAMKSQDTVMALVALSEAAPPDTPVVCVQNGVENERQALRLFRRVYGVCVMCPAGHLQAGTVQAYSTPVTGMLDVGRYPNGVDDLVVELASAFGSSTFDSVPRGAVMRWKYRKLLTNLGNAVEAVCGPTARRGPVVELAREEGVACLEAAGIDFATEREDADRRGSLLQVRSIAGEGRTGGSSWQSLARGAGSIETDYLNGEIVLLGRLFGIPTPVNELLCRHARAMATAGSAPGTMSEQEFLAQAKGTTILS